MTIVHLVRHGRAAAGWDDDPDPDLDEVGVRQSDELAERLAPLGPLPLVTSPLLRCRRTAGPLERLWASTAVVEPLVAEIPSPHGVPMGERVAWLRTAIDRRWADLGPRYTEYRDSVVRWVVDRPTDTVVFSHFVAINAVIGACLADDRVVVRRLDNCSVTRVAITDGELRLLDSGHEADTLIR
ncbi:MAG: histidine phosphatase family protein [Nocardiopsis sp. BM-2018]|nr:MAG: histidine phosphatase family protein [Nocardiopsis sp. BM-2018]